MKKLLFSGLAIMTLFAVQAQCTPDGSLIADAFGVYPDTTQNFAIAEVGVPYTQVLHFKAPTNAGDIDPNLSAFTISSFTVSSVTGIPPGLSYACNISSCQYPGGATGCAAITGTPTEVGTFEITINVTAVITLFGNNTNYPTSFSGYRIHVVPAGTASLSQKEQTKWSIYPNPVQSELTIQNLGQIDGATSVNIFNVEGKMMKSVQVSGEDLMIIQTNDLFSGVYFVEIQNATGVERKKFIKD